eukprot:CAMPEP_0194729490 /NCGR_PEP_ID=MMETSP0296-20130528/47319_1 /TAXON_ID=39354 /ORGANISM="Heterosigma akashiwo, Strain CCMP2393" /LENGTH=31 /DNA_ID= /DNA_START= /DNA_END= /DNA_ORIENTATION=
MPNQQHQAALQQMGSTLLFATFSSSTAPPLR